MSDILTIGLAQISPEWLDRKGTLEKTGNFIEQAASENCELIVFGEGLIPGYPFWTEHTDGARFESEFQKELYAHYLDQAVRIDAGHLDPICTLAREKGINIVTGIIEAATDRGGHSVYASLVYIDKQGQVRNVHRKLMPTYEERLVWAQGDGHGLKTFPLGSFTMGGLNCWENWMPLARTSLYAQGEDLHISIWPGSVRNTVDITRWIARESRSYVIGVSGLLSREHVGDHIPHAAIIRERLPEVSANGGTCMADPKGNWVLEPVQDEEGLFVVQADHKLVRMERQNFDAVGHYSRPDVLQLQVNRERQGTLKEAKGNSANQAG